MGPCGKPERLLQHGIMEQGTAGFLYQQSCIPVGTDAVEGSFHASSHLPAKLCLYTTCESPFQIGIHSLFGVFLLHPVITEYPADI